MALVYVLGTVHNLPYLMCSSVYFMDFEQISLAKIDKWQIFCLQKIPHVPADFYNTVANRFIFLLCLLLLAFRKNLNMIFRESSSSFNA